MKCEGEIILNLNSFLEKLGVATALSVEPSDLKQLQKRADDVDINLSVNRYGLISDFFDHFRYICVDPWNHLLQEEKLTEELKQKINYYIESVSVHYDWPHHKFIYGIDKDYLLGLNMNTYFEEETEVLEFLSPGWGISNLFIEEDLRREYAEGRIIEVVKNIVEKKGILNALYDYLPELLKEGIIPEEN